MQQSRHSLKRERRVRLELCSPAGQQRTGGRIRMGWRAGRRAYGAAVSALGYPGGPRARGSRLGGAGAGRDAPSGTCGMIGTTSWSALCLLQSSERAEDAPCAWPSRSPTARSASDGSEPAHLLNLHGWRLRGQRATALVDQVAQGGPRVDRTAWRLGAGCPKHTGWAARPPWLGGAGHPGRPGLPGPGSTLGDGEPHWFGRPSPPGWVTPAIRARRRGPGWVAATQAGWPHTDAGHIRTLSS